MSENVKHNPPNDAHPLDFSALQKGEYITPEHIERIYGVSPTSERFNLIRLALRDQIRKQREDLVVKCHKRGLLICPDTLASEHLSNRVNQSKRRIKRDTKDLTHRVNAAGFDADQRRLHESRLRQSQGLVIGIAWAERATRRGQILEAPSRRRLSNSARKPTVR